MKVGLSYGERLVVEDLEVMKVNPVRVEVARPARMWPLLTLVSQANRVYPVGLGRWVIASRNPETPEHKEKSRAFRAFKNVGKVSIVRFPPS